MSPACNLLDGRGAAIARPISLRRSASWHGPNPPFVPCRFAAVQLHEGQYAQGFTTPVNTLAPNLLNVHRIGVIGDG
jgi:hypothetical protein